VNKMIPSIRRALDNNSILQNLGLPTDFAGTWHGTDFNLVARPLFGFPDAQPPIPASNLFLELNLTDEIPEVVPISSSIPNRGTFQEDLEIFGLTYLQKISDATTRGALHIEPRIREACSPPNPRAYAIAGTCSSRPQQAGNCFA
jgi:hypothetical protein